MRREVPRIPDQEREKEREVRFNGGGRRLPFPLQIPCLYSGRTLENSPIIWRVTSGKISQPVGGWLHQQ